MMKSLAAVQKTVRVFRVLAKIGMIVSFVWAGLSAVGLLCGIAWYSGGLVAGANQEALLSLTLTDSLNQMMGVLLSDLVFALTDGILMLFALRYFKAELEDGTPFTHSGADQIRRLGVRTIVLPLVATILSAVFCELFALSPTMVEQSNLESVVVGIVLILASLIFRYGADLEANAAENKQS